MGFVLRLAVLGLAVIGALSLVPGSEAAEAVLTLPDGYEYAEHNSTATATVGTHTEYGRETVLVETSTPGFVLIRATMAGQPDFVQGILTVESSTAALVAKVSSLESLVGNLRTDVSTLTAELAVVKQQGVQNNASLAALGTLTTATKEAAEGAENAAERLDTGGLNALARDVERIGDDQETQAAAVEKMQTGQLVGFLVVGALVAAALASSMVNWPWQRPTTTPGNPEEYEPSKAEQNEAKWQEARQKGALAAHGIIPGIDPEQFNGLVKP